MLDPLTEHPPNPDSVASNTSVPCATAGQRAAASALSEAVAQRQPLILLFGDAGVGKTALIGSFLATVDRQEFFAIQVSATSGDFAGPPSFDALLEVICRRLVAPQPIGQRPATLAVLAAAVGSLARAGRTVLLAIDHADHLTNNVITEATRLGEYLDTSPASFVCILIGSPNLASRLDAALRRPGVAQRVPEIRVSHPSADELAALLAYEDTAQPGGPILTPGAIDRIGVYAKANLHWAAPLADAARTLAANQGEHEVTPELVRRALFELWSPEQAQPGDTTTRAIPTAFTTVSPESATMTPAGMSDVPLGSLSGADVRAKPSSSSTANWASSVRPPPVSPTGPMTSNAAASLRAPIRGRTALLIALAASALLIVIGIVAIAITDLPDHIGQSEPGSVSPTPPSPALQSPPELTEGEIQTESTADQQDQTMPPAEPAPLDGVKPEAERSRATNSESDRTSVPIPALPNITLSPPSPDASSPAAKALNAKKPAPPKASRKGHDEVPSDRWIQTR